MRAELVLYSAAQRKGGTDMKHGFVKVAAATPDIRVADVEFNTKKICEGID